LGEFEDCGLYGVRDVKGREVRGAAGGVVVGKEDEPEDLKGR
jgi:hypothetical protein